jgi:phenylacetate-CoA ligase
MRRLLVTAGRHVPFHRQLWAATGIDAAELRLPDDFLLLPVLRKQDLLAAGERLIDERWARDQLYGERTSGSSGEPFTMLLDPRTRLRRQLRFLAALFAVGYRPRQKLLFISTRGAGLLHRALGWTCADLTSGEEALLRTYMRVRPRVVYGPLRALVSLARAVSQEPGAHRPELVISTAERIGSGDAALLDAWSPRVADFYGLTELGLVAWRAPGAAHYRSVPGIFCELLPDRHSPECRRLVLTETAPGAVPVIRYETGDLARVETRPEGAVIRAIEGREVDFLRLPGGAALSPYRITTQLESIAGMAQYQVVQRADLGVDVYVRANESQSAIVMKSAAATLRALCGPRIAVRVHPMDGTVDPLRRKHRPVQSLAVTP